MSDEVFNVDEITVINEGVPPGEYKARLLDMIAEQKPGKFPCLYATWEVVSGEHEGKEPRSFYSLSVTRKANKRGVMATYASGIAEYTAALRLIKPGYSGTWPVQPTLELAEQAAVAFKKAFQGKVVTLKVTPNVYERDGETVQGTRVKVTGLGSPVGAASASSSSNMFDDL